MKTLKGIFGLIGVSALVLTVLPAANAVTINPVTISDSLKVFYPDGTTIFKQTNANEGDPEGIAPAFEYIVDSNLGNPAAVGHPTVFFEIGPAGQRIVSDIVGVTLNPDASGNYVIAYFSDDTGIFDLAAALQLFGATINTAIFIPETGSPQDVTPYVNPIYSTQGYTATFVSDLDVPDGGSAVALLGIALAGIEGARRILRARKA